MMLKEAVWFVPVFIAVAFSFTGPDSLSSDTSASEPSASASAHTDFLEPSDCDENEEFTAEPAGCEPTCKHRLPDCPMVGGHSCRCKKGYIRMDEGGKCIKEEICEEGVCGENEGLTMQAPDCEPTCKNHTIICLIKTQPSCHCRRGYVRLNRGGKCIKEGTCKEESEFEDVCSQKVEEGKCRARIPRYYFDQRTGQCEEFVYGGCEGNGNNFETREECESRCATKVPDTSEVPRGAFYSGAQEIQNNYQKTLISKLAKH